MKSEQDLETIKAKIDLEKKQRTSEKNRNYRNGRKCKSLFGIIHEIDDLKSAVELYQNGDSEFQHEFDRSLECEAELSKQGYSYEEVKRIEVHCKEEGKRLRKAVSDLSKEQNLLKDIIAECERMRDISHDKSIIYETNEKKLENIDKENNEKIWQPKKR